MTEVSFIIVSYNHFDILKDSIRSIKSYTRTVEYEIIIVDNNSSEGNIFDYIETEKGISIYKNEKNLGWPAAVNQAIAYSKGKYLCLVDNDVIFIEDIVGSLLEISSQLDNNAILAPCLLYKDKSKQPSIQDFPTLLNQTGLAFCLNILFPSSKYLNPNYSNTINSDKPFRIDMAMGACLFFPKSLALRINGFDEDFFFYGSDSDFCLRNKKNKGDVIYSPLTRVVHLRSVASGKLNFMGYRYLSRDNVTFYRKHYTNWKRSLFFILLIIAALNRSAAWLFLGCVTFRIKYCYKSISLLMKAIFIVKEIIKTKH